MSDAVKLMWYAAGFNALVAAMNLGFLISRSLDGNWWGAAMSLFLTALNTWSALFIFRRCREYQQQEKQKVADILSGKYDKFSPGWIDN